FIAHAYQYEIGHSTWIFETDPATFQRAGLEGLSEQQSANRMHEIFGWFLGSYPLLTNRSMWRNFPMIRSKRWINDNMVLLNAVTDANLSRRVSDSSAEVDRAFAREVRDKGFDVDIDNPVPPAFQPMRLRGMTLANRAVVSPMCMYSANEVVPGDFHFVHYGA